MDNVRDGIGRTHFGSEKEYLVYLIENGFLPEALHVSPVAALELCSDIVVRCDAAKRPPAPVRVHWGAGEWTVSVQVWEFPNQLNAWVVGAMEVGIFGAGRDLDHAVEYLTERLSRLHVYIAIGELFEIRPRRLRSILSWFGTLRRDIEEKGEAARSSVPNAIRAYQKGNYALATTFLERANAGFRFLEYSQRDELRRFSAFTSVRCGLKVAGAYGIDHLNERLSYRSVNVMTCSDFLCCTRYGGLMPCLMGEPWFKRGLELSNGEDLGGQALLYQYWGMTQLAHGDLSAARELLEDALAIEVDGWAETRFGAQILAGLAEVDRLQGELDRGRATLEQVRRVQEAEGLWGDLADFTLPGLAKYESDVSKARQHLRRAKHYAVMIGSPKANLRVHLIEARMLRESFSVNLQRKKVERLIGLVGDVQTCALVKKILGNWERWTGRGANPNNSYWGL